MSTEHREPDLIRSWLDESYEAERDPHDYLDHLLDEVPETPQQRRRWWPLPLIRRTAQTPTAIPIATTEYQPNPIPASNGQTPTVIGRTQSMLSPAKAITAGAIIAAVGGAFLIAQPFQQQGTVPGATAPAAIAARVGSSYFTGEMTLEGMSLVAEPEDTVVDGVRQSRGALAEGAAIEASDPRVSGSLTMALNDDNHEVAQFRTLAWRIENDAGAWSGQGTELVHGDATGGSGTSTLVLTGEGAYEGHTLYLIMDASGEPPFSVEGAVFVGEAPPFPEVPAPAE